MTRLIEERALIALLLTVLLGPAALLGQVAAQAITDFLPVDYVVEVDGDAAQAEVFQSRRAGAFLLMGSDLEVPVLLRLREAAVETVNLMKVDRRADGIVLLPDPVLASHGTFRVSEDGSGVSFSLDGRDFSLKEKPPLLGLQGLDGMKGYSRDYVRTAEAYSPSAPILARLRSETRPVKVEVYFGTWCPFCQEMVPRIMRVAEELAGSNIEVVFYGLPRGISSDLKAREMDIDGVPTGVIYVGGREVGRIKGNGWRIPELTINNVLVRG